MYSLAMSDTAGLNGELRQACSEGASAVASPLRGGADINSASSSGNTALIVACDRGLSDIAKLLVESGADVNSASRDGAQL